LAIGQFHFLLEAAGLVVVVVMVMVVMVMVVVVGCSSRCHLPGRLPPGHNQEEGGAQRLRPC
jgi:hypothetical protein